MKLALNFSGCFAVCLAAVVAGNRANQFANSDNSQVLLEKMRIENIKQTILDKLRLERPPRAPTVDHKLPDAVVQQMMLSSSNVIARLTGLEEIRAENFTSVLTVQPQQDQSNSIAEFYAQNDEILLLPENSSTSCLTDVQRPNDICVEFNIDNLYRHQSWIATTNDGTSVERAIMFIPMPQLLRYRPLRQTIRISSPLSPSSQPMNTVHIIDQNSEKTGNDFMPVDITEHVQQWLTTGLAHWRFHIHCSSCSWISTRDNHSVLARARPYLTLFPREIVQKHRTRRSLDCAPGMDSCCRKELLVDFASIGWDQWILHPKQYHSYYCSGSCNRGIHFPHTDWTMLMQHRMSLTTETTAPFAEQNVQVPICCAPTRMAPLSLLYYDEDGNILKARMPNMIVTACGCS